MRKSKSLSIIFVCLFLVLEYNLFCETKVQKITIRSGDFYIVGEYVSSREDAPTLILLHGLGSVRQEWELLTNVLKENGFGYFVFDLRGHGESVKTVSGKERKFDEFRKIGAGSEWEKMVNDLDSVIKYLVKEKRIKEENIILCGASLGANICLIYTSKNPKIKNIILLSPGWEYAGLKTESALKKIDFSKKKLLFASSPLDYYSYSSTRQLIKIVNSYGIEVTFLEGKNAQHGVQMFEEKFLKKLVDWLNLIRNK